MHETKELDQARKIALRLEVIRNTVQAGAGPQKGQHVRQVKEEDSQVENQEQGGYERRRRRRPWSGNQKQQEEIKTRAVSVPTEASGPMAAGNSGAQPDPLMDLMKRYMEKERETEELRKALGRKECVDTVKALVPTGMAPTAAQAVQPQQKLQVAPQGNRGACFNCGETDHWQNNCPHQRRNRGPRQPREYQRNEREG